MPVEWIEHKGKRILYSNLQGMDSDQVIAATEQVAQMVREIPSPTRIRFLTDFSDAVVDTRAMAKLKEAGEEVFEPRMEKAAVLGIEGIRHILLAAYNRVTGGGKNQKLFDNQDDALAWLVSESD